MTTYLRIKTESCQKCGVNASGLITFAILKNSEETEVYFCLISNEGGGYFSREVVPLTRIQKCIAGVKPGQSIPAKTFKPAFESRSSCNAGFLLAVLKSQQLLRPAADASRQHVLGDDWEAWKRTMLASPGEPFDVLSTTKPSDAISASYKDGVDLDPAEEEQTRTGSRKRPAGKRQHPTLQTEDPLHAQVARPD